MPVEPAALRRLMATAIPALAPVPVGLVEATGLVLATPVVAPFGLPRFTNAAMDGYALRAEDTARPPVRLRITGHSLAGAPPSAAVGPGEAVAIATGALLPAGADTVVPIEDVNVEASEVVVPDAVPPGRNVRRGGEDVAEGQIVVPPGTILGPGQIAAASALGVTQVVAHPRPRVAILPTGDEIRPPGSVLAPGQTYDAVSAALSCLLAEAGAVPILHEPAPDDPEGLRRGLQDAAAGADAVLSIGGVSVGERDLLAGLGPPVAVTAYQVALRPARPFGFGIAFGTPLVCLPGNPGSALAAFEELVRPIILGMLGRPRELRPSRRAILAEALAPSPGALHLVRAVVWEQDGALRARPAGRAGAAMMHALAAMNAWAVVPPGTEGLPAGAEVEVRLLGPPLTED